MKPFSELETLEECQRQMLQVARGILDGRIGIVAGARELTQLLFPLHLSDDPDALTLREIESETGHLPVGDARRHWSAEALKAAVNPSDPSTWKGKLRGEAGTKVRVVLADTPQSEPRKVELTRARVV